MRRQRRFPILVIIGAGAGMLLLILLFGRVVPALFGSSAVETVEEFYTYEQEGDFGSAWELFHSTMQARFSKNAYVTERSHIYMSHYGVTTFSFEIMDDEKLDSWKSGQKTLEDVRKVQVKQTFHSKFGTFSIIQDIYAVKEKDQWRLLWKFK